MSRITWAEHEDLVAEEGMWWYVSGFRNLHVWLLTRHVVVTLRNRQCKGSDARIHYNWNECINTKDLLSWSIYCDPWKSPVCYMRRRRKESALNTLYEHNTINFCSILVGLEVDSLLIVGLSFRASSLRIEVFSGIFCWTLLFVSIDIRVAVFKNGNAA